MAGTIKRFAKELCPPLLWRAARSLYASTRRVQTAAPRSRASPLFDT